MKINFAMWRKASWELIKMDDKKEWDALDVVSKWLIASRSAQDERIISATSIHSSLPSKTPNEILPSGVNAAC